MKPLLYNTPWIQQRADPYVYHDGQNGYYFTASVPEYDGICLRHADSLQQLPEAAEKEVWHKHDNGPQSIHIWAPELHKIDGKWFIYYSGGDKDDIWNIRPYVLACQGNDPMTDAWQELGKMQAAEDDPFSFRAFSLDATVLCNGGTWYYAWSEKVGPGKQIANLYIAKMEAPNRLATPQVLLSSPSYSWERHGFWVNEGPAFLQHNGRVFLTYSASETGIHYCMGMLSASAEADLTDPTVWKKSRRPVLETDAARGIFGPGHNCFITDDTGADVMVYHARTESHISGNPLYNPNRHAMLMPIRWDEQGAPVFSYDNM